jgi:hypothetical protein
MKTELLGGADLTREMFSALQAVEEQIKNHGVRMSLNAVRQVNNALQSAREHVAEQETLQAYRDAADRLHTDEGTIEVDDNAIVSKGEDDGAYVAAWVWVYDDDVKEDSHA